MSRFTKDVKMRTDQVFPKFLERKRVFNRFYISGGQLFINTLQKREKKQTFEMMSLT